MASTRTAGIGVAVAGVALACGAGWHLRRGQAEQRLWYGRLHRYVVPGEPHYDGLVTNHELLMGFGALLGAVGAVAAVRGPRGRGGAGGGAGA